MSDPLDVDDVLVRRVSTKVAARYLGCSTRQVLDLIREGELPGAIDTSSPGSKRASWGVPVLSLRAFVVKRELRARNIGAHGMTEPETAEIDGTDAARERP